MGADLLSAWDALAAGAGEPNPFMERWFAAPSLALRGAHSVNYIAVWSGDVLLGIGLFSIATRYGRIPVRHVRNWQSVQSFYGGPLIRAGFETIVWTEMLDTLDAARWAPAFLTVADLAEDGPVHRGLCDAAARRGDPAPVVHRRARALLQNSGDAQAYLDAALRGKKRKELRRLAARLAEMGSVTYQRWSPDLPLDRWCDDFLALEAAGWKGSDGAAFANTPKSTHFFRQMMAGAAAADVLDFQRIDLDGRAIAMLINFHRAPGSYSFKIAYDEALARFSPGVMIEIENLKALLAQTKVAWMDSCATENHAMINGLWMERRTLIQTTVPLKGAWRRAQFSACRTLEAASAKLRSWRAA